MTNQFTSRAHFCMDAETFIAAVLNRLPTIDPPDPDAPGFIRVLQQQGFTVGEAIAYCSLTEEYNPTLDEDVALARMKAIQTKVEGRRRT